MNRGSRNKTLITIIGVLLVANIVMLVLFLRMEKCPEEVKGPGFTERLKSEVGFTDQQLKIFEPKKREHWKKVRERFDSIKRTKVIFYNQMYDPTIPDTIIWKRAQLIGDQQAGLDYQVIKYFKDVRTMCTPQQLPKYDSLLPVIVKWITERPRK